MSVVISETPEPDAPAAEVLRLAEAAGASAAEARAANSEAMDAKMMAQAVREEVQTLRALNESAHAEIRANLASLSDQVAALAIITTVETESETEDSETEEAEAVTMVEPPAPSSAGADAPASTPVPQRERGMLARLFLGT